MIHASDCDGDDAPWCSPACVHANRLVGVADVAALLGVTADTVYGLVRRRRLTPTTRRRRDRGRAALLFSVADVHAYAEARDTPTARGA